MYDQQWVPQFQELHTLVKTHVASEKNEMFGKIQAVMTPQEAEERGGTVEAAQEATSRNASPKQAGHPSKLTERVCRSPPTYQLQGSTLVSNWRRFDTCGRVFLVK